MVSKKLTISCPEHLLNFLDEHEGLSASKVFQGAIENIQNSLKSNPQLMEANKHIAKMEKVREHMQEDLQKATEFLTLKELWEEYSKWRQGGEL